MKRFFMLTPALILAAVLASSCGRTANCPAGQYSMGNTCVASNGFGAQCSNGQIYTQYGCLSQGSCPAGQAWYAQGNTCVAALQNGFNNGFNNGFGGFGMGNCMAGQVFTSMGCLPQGPCQYGMGYLQMSNQCIPGQMNGFGNGFGCPWGTGFSYTTYSCLPQGGCPFGMYRYGLYCVN